LLPWAYTLSPSAAPGKKKHQTQTAA